MEYNFNNEDLKKTILSLFNGISRSILEDNLEIKVGELFIWLKWSFKFKYNDKIYTYSRIARSDITKEELAGVIARKIASKTNWELKINEDKN